MTIVADEYRHVMGAWDTHARTHTYAIVDTSTGVCTGTESFPTTATAIRRAIAWMKRNTNGKVLAAIEVTSSCGAGLTRALKLAGIPVAEVKPPRRKPEPVSASPIQLTRWKLPGRFCTGRLTVSRCRVPTGSARHCACC